MAINKKNWLTENSDKDNKKAKDIIEKCKFCFKLWCDWGCINKEILGIIEKNKYLFDDENFLVNQQLFESKNYSYEINKIKNQLLELLYIIDYKSISWERLVNLWNDIIYFWTLIWLWESLTLGENKKLNNQDEVYENIEEQNYEKSLRDIKSDLACNEELAEFIIRLFINSLHEYSWEKILEKGNILIKIWEKMQMLEIIAKLHEIKK